MKKLILTSAAILMGMTSATMALPKAPGSSAGPNISINNVKVGNTLGLVVLSDTAISKGLPGTGNFYGAINIGPTVQASSYKTNIQNINFPSLSDPDDMDDGEVKDSIFLNVGTQYTPTFKYPATVKTITETTKKYDLTVNWNDDDHDVEFNWPL